LAGHNAMFVDLVLSSALRKRTRYVALMSLGIAMMLVAVAGSISKDEAAAIGAWAVGFLVLSVLLLGALSREPPIRQDCAVGPGGLEPATRRLSAPGRRSDVVFTQEVYWQGLDTQS
jgi:uncharacterized membrane protein YfcA